MKTVNLVLLIVGSVILGFLLLSLIGFLAFSHEAASRLSQTTQPTTETPATETPEFLTYNNPTYRIRIKYPSDWEKDTQTPIVTFKSPATDESNRKAVLSISTEDLSAQPMTLEEYTKLSLEAAKQISSFELLDSSAAILDGRPAHKVIYSMKVGQYNIKTMVIYTIKGNIVYPLTYVAETSKYDEFSDDLQEMINSFEII